MAQQTINNGESGLIVRGKLNSMFTELYNASLQQRVDRETIIIGTNTITFSSAMPSANYEVIIYDLQGLGITEPTAKTINGFQIDSLTAGDIVYLAIETN